MMRIFSHEKSSLDYEDLIAETLPSGRVYTTPEGKKYPSITTVLGARGKDSIMEWRARVGAEEANRISRHACARGTAVHTVVEKYLQNDPDFLKGRMPHIISAFNRLKPLIDKNVGRIFFQEKALYSDTLGVAGRVDLIAEWDGQLSIIDVKTSSRIKSRDDIHDYFLQETFYSIALAERTGLKAKQLVTLMSVEDSNPIIFVERISTWHLNLIDRINDYTQNFTRI
jgi:hypothetical protein